MEWVRKKWNFQVGAGREPSRLHLCQHCVKHGWSCQWCAFCVNEWESEYTVTDAGSGRVGFRKERGKESGSGSEELRSGREAERTCLQLVRCALVHTVSYFGKLIGQKRKQGNRSRYSDWRYRRKHLSIYTNYVFHLEQVRRDKEWKA